SSGGIHWRYEYNENGNVTRTYFKPQFTDEYLVEEYTGYDDKLLDKTAENARMLQNITLSSSGINLSKNNVLAYKTYNPDGSVNTSYTITREYNAAGNQIKIITTAVAGGVTTTTAVDTEYPTCK
ncbi:MAG: hypothetical protein JWQ14_2624, partial [Adhaeribacter sp.]|nr:hypothetical protein [Adhaeribacter sp.]